MSFKWLLGSDALHHSQDGAIFVNAHDTDEVSHFANTPCPLLVWELAPAVKRLPGRDLISLDPQ